MKLLTLDLQFFAQEKTEKATPKKRRDSRKKGQVAKSQDVNTAILLLMVFILLIFMGEFLKNAFTGLYVTSFTEYIHRDVTFPVLQDILIEATGETMKVLAPIMVVAMAAAAGANVLQIGFLFTTEPLKFDLKKIDPIKGAKRIFSLRALVELVKSLLKITIIGFVTFFILWISKDDMMMLALKSADQSIRFFGETTLAMGIAASLALLVLSVLDYAYQRYDYEKNIRMSKQDIKDEHKNIEGDPQIKSKIKERQRQMAMRRMMSEIPEADVVITNPTHYAVAIKYDEELSDAPYVVAKGVDYLALKIRQIAKAHDVAIVENRQLARSLYQDVEIGEEIHEQFYQAVAEVLAYVYRMENRNVTQ